MSNVYWLKPENNSHIFFVKFTKILFIIYAIFLNIFAKILKIFARLFRIFLNFSQNFNLYYYSKVVLFSNFRCIFSTVPHSLIDICQVFGKFLFFFQRFTQSLDKFTPSVTFKKSLAQEVRQKSDILDRRSKVRPLQPLLCLQHVQLCHCPTCQGSSYTKNEYSLFYRKLDAEYFFIRQFFRKKLYFQRKPQKTVLGAHLTIF